MNKKQTEKLKKINSDLIIRTIILVFIVLALGCTFFFREKVENLINYNLNKDALSTVIEQDGLTIHFVDVGQADCTIVEFPNGEFMFIDTGHYYKTSNEKLQNYLRRLDFKYENGEPIIDYLVLTHPDSDHIGGASYLFQNFLVKNCFLPQIYYYNPENTQDIPWEIPFGGVTCSDDIYRETIEMLDVEIQTFGCNKIYTSEFLKIKSSNYDGTTATIDNSMWIVEFFTPITGKTYTEKNKDIAIKNDYSPIMILNFLGKKIMLTGDIGQTVEQDFIEHIENGNYSCSVNYFDVDILKVAHHGSKYSTTTEFLEIVKPEIAIISVGKNSYGHPSSETTTRLEEAGVNPKCIYRTDLNGNIQVGISLDGDLSLRADHIQYSTFEFKLWHVILIVFGASVIIIYSPYVLKVVKIRKKAKK